MNLWETSNPNTSVCWMSPAYSVMVEPVIAIARIRHTRKNVSLAAIGVEPGDGGGYYTEIQVITLTAHAMILTSRMSLMASLSNSVRNRFR